MRRGRIKSVGAEALGIQRKNIWYLATIEDLATRQIIAAKIGKRHDSQLVLATLRQAFATRQRPMIFHSDQGTEFIAQQCTDTLEARGAYLG